MNKNGQQVGLSENLSTKEDKAFYKEGKVLCALQDAIKKYEENKKAKIEQREQARTSLEV